MGWILLIVTGLIAGLLGSLMGMGGGIIIVPALMFFRDFNELLGDLTPQTIVGTSLMLMIITGLSSTLAYMKQKTVDYMSGGIFFLGSGPGALFGVWLNKDIAVDPFLISFGVFIVCISFLLLIRDKFKPLEIRGKGIRRTYINNAGIEIEYGFTSFTAIFISFIVGLFSGLFGIGGGSLMVPVMILLFGFPPHLAVATSMFMVFLSAIVSSISHIALGNVEWMFALALVPGAWIGAKLGAIVNQRLESATLVTFLRILLIIIGLRMIWQGFTG